ncbi:MAG: hypothetical protein AAGN46_16000 [Acidobacteriota bacterium]
MQHDRPHSFLVRFVAVAGVALAMIVLGVLPSGAEDSTTLTGEYHWNQIRESGDLRAVFTPTGEATWDVAFHFRFNGQPHVYEGTANGSLTDGELAGKVFNENKRRTFTFEGKTRNGTFRGEHQEISRRGRVIDTGTLELAR